MSNTSITIPYDRLTVGEQNLLRMVYKKHIYTLNDIPTKAKGKVREKLIERLNRLTRIGYLTYDSNKKYWYLTRCYDAKGNRVIQSWESRI